MAKGASAIGYPHSLKRSTAYNGRVEHEVAVFYGLASGLRRVFDDYRKRGRAIYIDLGYWGRRKVSRFDGYHKLVLNSRHPTDYFQNQPKPSDRFDAFKVQIKPWRREGRHVLVVGMSAKAAIAEELLPESWERETIERLRRLTKRPIIYRPKPNWDGARAIPGAGFSRNPLERDLRGCHAVVARHSNVAVDALMAGIPCICPHGVASRLAGHDLSQIETPPMPDGREQWAADLAYTQWSIEEMERGDAIRYLINEGLIPPCA